MLPTDENEVKTLIKKLKNKTVSGFDEVSVELDITPAIVMLTNQILTTGKLPSF